MSEWKTLDKDRLYQKHKDGFLIIKPRSDKEFRIIPFDCPVCGFFMRAANDITCYSAYECCSRCATKWAEGINRTKWLEGWRPSEDELTAYREFRRQQLR